MKSVKQIAVLLALLLLLSACSSGAQTQTPHKVYLITKSTQTEFWISAFAGANAAKSEYNVELTILGPETEEDYQAQNDYIAQAVTAGAEAIVFSAISYTDNAAAIDAAAEQGVKIVVIDSDVDSAGVSVRIGTNNVEAGRMAGMAALDSSEPVLTVAIVNYDAISRNGQERETGMREVLDGDPRVRAVYTINVLSEQEDAKQKTMQLLRAHPEINVVVGFNEPVTVGVALAVEEMNCAERVRMVGFDSNTQVVDLMQDGVVAALIVQNPYAMGYLGVEAAWRLLEGGSYDPHALTDTATTIITKETMFTLEGQKALFPFG